MLVDVGNGVLAPKGDNADYVVICEEQLAEAQALSKSDTQRLSLLLLLVLLLCCVWVECLCLWCAPCVYVSVSPPKR